MLVVTIVARFPLVFFSCQVACVSLHFVIIATIYFSAIYIYIYIYLYLYKCMYIYIYIYM
jgi:hypothetical protein